MQLILLLKEKIKLHSKKYHLIDRIDKLGLNELYLKELKTLLKKELRINKQLKKEIKALSRFINARLINEQLKNIFTTTKKQLDILNRIKLHLFKKTNYKQIKEACRKEVEQNKFFSKIIQETVSSKELKIPTEEFKKEKFLLKQAQKTYKELIKSIGNVRKVRQKAKELILINKKIKQTQMYEFIKFDIDQITTKAKYALKNPKESKLRFFLASAYIISPGTFELTGIYLFFRYTKRFLKTNLNKRKTKKAS